MTLTALAQGGALFTKWRVGERKNIVLPLGPAGTVATEMSWVVFPGGTVLHGHKKTVTSAYRVRYGCANREAPLSCRWRGKALLNRVGVIELERLLREV